jgi:NAD(P)-dependent dehydrogenase (short-subunit alcohol dehydrogenase family)
MLDNKVVIITGAARGLGAATAKAFCEAGAKVMLTDILPELETTTSTLRGMGFDVECIQHDVTNTEQWANVVAATLDRWDRVDSLVNNAGINYPVDIEEATEDQFKHILDVNLIGPFKGMKAVIPAMKNVSGASIINIASTATKQLLAVSSIYSASKAGLTNLSKCAAIHLAETGTQIRVNTIHPGPHGTNMLLGDKNELAHDAVKPLLDSIPMGRIGNPNEVGKVAVFLASEAASYMTGAELFVDGGLTLV